MAVIQKIRNQYGKLTVFIIVLALVGFILMDAASGRFGELLGQDTYVAKVNGDKIDMKEYSQRVKEYESLYNYSSKGRPMDEATRAQLNDQALNELINEKLVSKLCADLGLQTTKEEEKDLIYGASPDPIVQQYPVFMNPDTKMFDPQRVKAFEQQVDQVDPTGKMKDEWNAIKAYILRNNLLKKYNAMVANGVYTPKFVVENTLKQQSELASIRFVKVPYQTVNDNEVKVTDEDMKAYMKKREKQYSIDQPTRSIEYVSFDVTPSAEDTSKSLGTINQLKAEFATNTDNESFVNRNSDDAYNAAFVNKKSFMSAYADSIMNLPAGAVYGPYYENGSYKLTKVVEKTTLPDSAKCRHILVKTGSNGQTTISDTAAKLKIDSAVAAINAGMNFNEAVQKYSEDEGSKATAGEYTFTLQQRPQISKEFGDFVFEGKPGEKKTVKVENEAYSGYHYIEILEQKGMETAAKLATISKSLYAGETTESSVYAKATEFAGKNGNAKAFDETVKKENLNKRNGDNLKANDFMIPGLGSAREIIRWMYDAKVGDVSSVFNLDGRYVVAKLSAQQDAGLMKLDANLRQVIEPAIKAEKKAEIIVNKYKSVKTLEALAQASAQQIMQADSFNGATPFIPNVGYEPKVAGYAFYTGFKVNTMSPAIKGQDGVIYMVLTNKTSVPVTTDQFVISQQMGMQQQQNKNAVGGAIQDMLRKNADIKYSNKNL